MSDLTNEGRPQADTRSPRQQFPKNRTEAFSDGVFAIAITLLILEVHVPTTSEVEKAGSLVSALLQGWAHYLSYFATFLTIGVIWLNHRAVFDKIRALDHRLQWWNLILMLSVAFIPFPNALVAEYVGPDLFSEPARTATITYALVFTASTVPWVLIWSRLARRPELLAPQYTQAYALLERRRSLVGLVLYAVGIAIASLVPVGAVLLFIGVALFYALTAAGSRLDGDDDS